VKSIDKQKEPINGRGRKVYSLLYKYAGLLRPSGRRVHRNLKDLLYTQWLPLEELQALQLRKIQHLVAHAYTNVPFYRQRFQEAGIDPSDIKTLDDFRRIPVLTRDDVQRNLKSLVAKNIPSSALRPDATGGATGEPLRFYNTIEHIYWKWAGQSRIRSWFGLEPGCKQAYIAGRDFAIPHARSEKIRVWFRRQKWLNSFDMSREKMQAFAETLVRFQPQLIVGYNSSLWLFAQYLEQTGFTGIHPKVVIGAADKLYDFERELIEKVFGCSVRDCCSGREVGVMAVQCPEGSMHVPAELNYLEVIANGQPAKPGELGEVIVTSLTNFGMPFIRYKNGDLARPEDQSCPCGRSLPVLRELVGRTSDFFTTPDGRLISGLYFVRKMRGCPGVKRYQVHQSSVDKVEIIFEARDDLDQDWLESRRREIQAHLGASVELSLRRVDHVPITPGGKRLFTTSAVPVDLSDGRASQSLLRN